MIATRSPIEIPEATRPFAAERISNSNSLALTLCQPSPSGRETMMRLGSTLARSAIYLVRFPEVAMGARGGIFISFMALTLA